MEGNKKVYIHTLGCKLNFAESSTLARQFEAGGFQRTTRSSEADICIINSCTVTEHADKKCRNIARKIHRENPSAIIAITGCFAQLSPEEAASVEGVDIVLGNNEKVNLFEKVQIPGYEDAIRKIKRFMEDEENLSKSSQKIVKAKRA